MRLFNDTALIIQHSFVAVLRHRRGKTCGWAAPSLTFDSDLAAS